MTRSDIIAIWIVVGTVAVILYIFWPVIRSCREAFRNRRRTLDGVRALDPFLGTTITLVSGVEYRFGAMEVLVPNDPVRPLGRWHVHGKSQLQAEGHKVLELYRNVQATPCNLPRPIPGSSDRSAASTSTLPNYAATYGVLVRNFQEYGAQIDAAAVQTFTESLQPKEPPKAVESEPKIKTKKDLLNEDPFLV